MVVKGDSSKWGWFYFLEPSPFLSPSEVHYLVIDESDGCPNQCPECKTIQETNNASYERDPVSDEELAKEVQMRTNNLLLSRSSLGFYQEPVSSDKDGKAYEETKNQSKKLGIQPENTFKQFFFVFLLCIPHLCTS